MPTLDELTARGLTSTRIAELEKLLDDLMVRLHQDGIVPMHYVSRTG